MLERFRSRADALDRDNEYFEDDLRRARAIGLPRRRRPIRPRRVGPLRSPSWPRSQRRLARYAPATALAISMHSYWIGIANELDRAGDSSLRWILEAAAAGEVFAAGHAEAGNDIPVLISTCRAERVDGGYRLTGRKQFGSNGPAWRWLGAHAIDVDAPGGPQIVHAFVSRSSPGVTRGRDLGHARHAPDAEPRHRARRCVRAGRAHRPGRSRRRRERPLHHRHGDVAAVPHRSHVSRRRRAGARACGRQRAPEEVGRDRPRHVRLQPDGSAPDRRDVPRARRGQRHVRAFRRRLG